MNLGTPSAAFKISRVRFLKSSLSSRSLKSGADRLPGPPPLSHCVCVCMCVCACVWERDKVKWGGGLQAKPREDASGVVRPIPVHTPETEHRLHACCKRNQKKQLGFQLPPRQTTAVRKFSSHAVRLSPCFLGRLHYGLYSSRKLL